MGVAVGYLGTEAARRALDVAARAAADRETNLTVIHVVEMRDETVVDHHRASVEQEVTDALEAAGLAELPWEVVVSTEDKGIADAIVDVAAAQGADLLVLGSRRRSSVGKVLFGSVTRTVVKLAEIEVTVVDSPDRE